MAKTKTDKRKIKLKEKLKNRQLQKIKADKAEKFEFLAAEAKWFAESNPEKALELARKSIAISPKDYDLLHLLGFIGHKLNRLDVQLEAMEKMYDAGLLSHNLISPFCTFLMSEKKYEKALSVAEYYLEQLPKLLISRNKRALSRELQEVATAARAELRYVQIVEQTNKLLKEQAEVQTKEPPPVQVKTETEKTIISSEAPLPEIPVICNFSLSDIETAFMTGRLSSYGTYELALAAYQIRLNETFDHLICLSSIQNVQSLWYQEETAKKVLKRFRGRALLADEVGLGKTIEALIVFLEYYQRGMIKNGLILTPTPLVSQWRDELLSKFGLSIPSSDDSEYRSGDETFWNAPFVLASINLAKSKKNFDIVTAREYDIVIVDEAHHLKNRATLNWKLVNSLKKKYLLLLTATPVENNLMELYNLITLLKPGQLKTASAFREEFMTRGDPTDPQNREKLKMLLGEVMIRNTRAVAKLNIPPRFAQTIRIESTKSERELYDRVTQLVKRINASGSERNRLFLKNLLAEAGSSPRAVSLTLERQQAKNEFSEDQAAEIKAIHTLCRTMNDTRKNQMLLNLVKSSPGKFIVFVKYMGTLEHLQTYLDWNRIPYALFHGGMSNAEKDEQINKFEKDIQVLITTEIGGEGRNLQFCNQMINYDLPWNPMKIEQRIGRIHRIGQKREVMIYNFCNAGSIEDYILEILDKKINMFEMVIGEIDMIIGRVQGEQDFSDMVFDIWVNSETEQDREQSFNQLSAQIKRSKTSYQKTKELDEKLFSDRYEL